MSKSLLRTSAALLALALTSCSLGFKRDWKKAATSPPSSEVYPLSGAWQGTWRSTSNGHDGTLKAIASPIPAAPGTPGQTMYEFRYHATWAKVLSGGYTTHHLAKYDSKMNKHLLSGEHDLGLLGGVFRYGGEATPTHFKATYDSKLDNGVFQMTRPVVVKD